MSTLKAVRVLFLSYFSMDNESLFLKQPPRILGLASAVKMLPTETGSGNVGNIINSLQDNYANQNSLVALGNKNNELILKEVVSINKKLEKMVGLSIDEDRRAKLRENRDRQRDSRALKGLERMGQKLGNSLKSGASNIAGGLIDTIFPGLSRMFQGLKGLGIGGLGGLGLFGLLFGGKMLKGMGGKLLSGSMGIFKLGKGLFSGATQRLFRQRMAKSGIFGALFGIGKNSFAGAKGAKEASNVIKSINFVGKGGKNLMLSPKMFKSMVGMMGLRNFARMMGAQGLNFAGTGAAMGMLGKSGASEVRMLGEVSRALGMGKTAGNAMRFSKEAKGINSFTKAARQMFSKSAGIGKFFAKQGGKTAGKVAAKKVPILGAILGTAFAIQRWKDGDKLGAGLELVSGLLSTVPGLGTAGSLLIDAGLFARDIGNANGQKGGLFGGIKGLSKGGIGGALATLLGGATGATVLQRLAQSGFSNLYETSIFGSMATKAGLPGLALLFDAFSGGGGQFMDRILNPDAYGNSTPSSDNADSSSTPSTGKGTELGKAPTTISAPKQDPEAEKKALIERLQRAQSRYAEYSDPWKDLRNQIAYATTGKPVNASMLQYYENAQIYDKDKNTYTGGVLRFNAKDTDKMYKYSVSKSTNPVVNNLLQHTITSGFGYRTNPITGEKGSFHKGIDLAYDTNEPVYANVGGTVIATGYQYNAKKGTGYGNYITIKGDDGKYYQYSHANKILAKKGQKVSIGDKLMLAGSTGGSTGTHVDYKVASADGFYYNPLTGEKTNVSARSSFMYGSKGTPVAVSVANIATDAVATLTDAVLPDMAGRMSEYTEKKGSFIDSVWAKYKTMESGASSFEAGEADYEAITRGKASLSASYTTGSLAPDKYNTTVQQALPSVDVNSLLWYQLLMQQ